MCGFGARLPAQTRFARSASLRFTPEGGFRARRFGRAGKSNFALRLPVGFDLAQLDHQAQGLVDGSFTDVCEICGSRPWLCKGNRPQEFRFAKSQTCKGRGLRQPTGGIRPEGEAAPVLEAGCRPAGAGNPSLLWPAYPRLPPWVK